MSHSDLLLILFVSQGTNADEIILEMHDEIIFFKCMMKFSSLWQNLD